MNKKQIERFLEVVSEINKDYDFNDYVINYIDKEDLEDIEDFEELEDYINNLNNNNNNEITQEEIIYYDNAIEYLAKNDASLLDSLELAEELGYTIKNINSELLASLLKTQENEGEYNNFTEELINKIKELDLFNEKGGLNE